ncbi:serine/threonine-protein kinase [Catenulispora subtropica]|uniref:non-specific serine/threonine protein kinase n=1 Tax=Catenulispora subtropica TaxID=450798 RepID=A0ABN2RRH2_9ACTN
MQPLQPGDPRTVGPYVLIARLGSGGMGHVFLGRTRGGRTVAVKAVKPELAGNPEFRRRFRQEVAAARLVSGPHTAPVVDADPEAAMPWLATAYVSGQTLRAAVAEGWRLPEGSLLVLAGGLARALAEIHAAGVVHRDLKPSNVMLAVEGPRVIDFGISRVTAATDYTRTDVGTIVGSPGFMSPEQSRGHSLTGATDVFSLGTVLAYAATGHNPFGAGPDHALLYRIGHAEPDLDAVPDRLVPLVRACLEKDPAHRPTTAQIIRHTAAKPEGPWLPAALTAAIAQNAAEILDYEGIAVFPERDTPAGNGRHAAGTGRHAAAGAPVEPGTRQTRIEAPAPETLVLPPDRAGAPPSERVGVGEPPREARGAGGAGWVVGVLAVAVIAALSTALVLVLRSGGHNPGTPPAASVTGGASTSSAPLPRSAHTSTPTRATTSTAPSPTATSNSSVPTAPTTAQSTNTVSPTTTTSSSSASSAPSSTPSTTPSSTPSSTPSTTPSSSASHSAAPTSASASRTGGAGRRAP